MPTPRAPTVRISEPVRAGQIGRLLTRGASQKQVTVPGATLHVRGPDVRQAAAAAEPAAATECSWATTERLASISERGP